MSRLLSSQVSAHNGSKVFCMRCLSHFSNKEKLAIHEGYCWNNDAQIQEMPEKGSFIIFKNHNHYIKVPFAVYADFESFTKEICEPKGKIVLNIRDINLLVFVIILNVLMIKYFNP